MIENFVISQMERLPDFSSIQGVIEKRQKMEILGQERGGEKNKGFDTLSKEKARKSFLIQKFS